MVHEGSRHFQWLIKEHLPKVQRIMVVRCGRSGKEVLDLAHALPAYIEGFVIKLDSEVNSLKIERYHIRLGDAYAMEYPDGPIDAVFYHHVIEHPPDSQRSIVGCARVLREGGYLYCGTPNHTRSVGYITEAELDAMIRPYFRGVNWLTSDYLRFKYGRRLPSVLLRLICWRPIRAVLAPAIYCWAGE